MSDEDFDPFVGGPPPDPSERTWRHPSEIAAEAAAGAREASSSRSTPHRNLGTLLPLGNRSLGAIIAGSLGAAACLTAIAVVQLGGQSDITLDPTAAGTVGAGDVVDIAPLEPVAETDDLVAITTSSTALATVSSTTAPNPEVVETAADHVVGIVVGDRQVASGVVFEGYVLTSASAVGDQLSVGVADEQAADATSIAYLVGVDPFTDLAVYRPSLDTRGARTTIPLRLLDSVTDPDAPVEWDDDAPGWPPPRPGLGADVAVASAGPDGLEVEAGVVIGVDQEQQAASGNPVVGLIDTSIRRSPQSAGGLLLSADGTAIGVVVDSTSSLASAVPLDVAVRIADQLTNQGWASETWIGFVGVDLDDTVEVVDVSPGSPADIGGLQPGDIVAYFDGSPVDHMAGITAGLRQAAPGDTLVVVVVRNGEFVSLQVTAEAYGAMTEISEPIGG